MFFCCWWWWWSWGGGGIIRSQRVNTSQREGTSVLVKQHVLKDKIMIVKIASTAKSFHNVHHGDNSTVAEVKRSECRAYPL